MYRIVRSIMLFALTAIAAVGLSGCITDPPVKRLYPGALYNFGASNLNAALVNPPPEYSSGNDRDKNYSIPRRFDAMQNGQPGVQSYWGHEKNQVDPPYDFLLTSLEGNPVAHLYVRPNGVYDDAPDPVYSKPGLSWWASFPNGGSMSKAEPTSSRPYGNRILSSGGCTAWIVMINPIGGDQK